MASIWKPTQVSFLGGSCGRTKSGKVQIIIEGWCTEVESLDERIEIFFKFCLCRHNKREGRSVEREFKRNIFFFNIYLKIIYKNRMEKYKVYIFKYLVKL